MGEAYDANVKARQDAVLRGQKTNLPHICTISAVDTCRKRLVKEFKKKNRTTGLQRTFDLKFHRTEGGKIKFIGARRHRNKRTHPQVLVQKFYKTHSGHIMTKLD